MQKTGGNRLLDVNLILKKAGIAESMNVADLGCGSSGHFIFPTARMVGKRGSVYAVDVLKTVLETIKVKAQQEHLLNIKTVWSDLEVFGATKIEPSAIDVALLINTLYQAKKRTEILREALRILKRGAKLVIVEWKRIASPIGPPTDVRLNEETLTKDVLRLGLNIESEFEAGEYHFGLVCSRV